MHRDGQPLRRRVRTRLALSLLTLAALIVSVGLMLVVHHAGDQFSHRLREAAIGAAGVSFGVMLLASLAIPIVLHFAKPYGYEEWQAAFRWAANRPGQGARGLPLGTLTPAGRHLELYKHLVRYRVAGFVLPLFGVLFIAVGIAAEQRWALSGALLIPAGIALHRWATGRLDAPEAARYLLEQYVSSMPHNPFGLLADAATDDPEISETPGRRRVVFPHTRGLHLDELEHRIYLARHNPEMAGTLWGRPRHIGRGRIHWEVTGDGALSCTVVDSRGRTYRPDSH
ncbi:hypothetical protein [Bogoriella caseilytica]|uniref:Uncharacterized protein n=1 Tax=Bogoriella caseilytica TaxID=56055 RepID=A0A3N2BDD7_9MICO|nr:hypothetical protein [Bogoriella caseilytica]ROR73258.1 hypothetical protein EDD31_1633 [Bogoriella caseilytica]